MFAHPPDRSFAIAGSIVRPLAEVCGPAAGKERATDPRLCLAGKFDEARLAIVGPGPRSDVEQPPATWASRIGPVRRADQRRGAHRRVHLRHFSDTEQMISLIEAMAAGLPVASVDVGDVAIMLAREPPLVTSLDDDALAAR
jgi:hypothetical protein